MANGESLFSYKARTTKTSSPKSQPHNRAKTPTPKSPAKPHNRAKTPTPLNKSQKWLKDNPPNRTGIVDELKSMVDPKNLTGANAITAAIKGDGMSTTKRITTGLSGVVQGLGFAAGGSKGKVGVEGVKNTGIPARIVNKVKKETVLVHGSPVKGLTEIKPSVSRALPNDARVFGMRTDVPLESQFHTQSVTEGYASGGSWIDKGKKIPEGGGSLYIIKTPKKATELPAYPKKPKKPKFTESGRPIIEFSPSVATSSSSAGKVVGEIPIAGKNSEAIRKALQQELKRAGVKTKSGTVKSMLNKAEQKKLAKRNRKNDPDVS
tara:strand:+ start:63 stop:1025 length:963 start_codon:yes stop_codon:yes gene_type:complete